MEEHHLHRCGRVAARWTQDDGVRAGAKAVQRRPTDGAHAVAEGRSRPLLIIDGAFDFPGSRKMMPDRPPDAFIAPIAVADTDHALTKQDRRGWSFEVEAKPVLANGNTK